MTILVRNSQERSVRIVSGRIVLLEQACCVNLSNNAFMKCDIELLVGAKRVYEGRRGEVRSKKMKSDKAIQSSNGGQWVYPRIIRYLIWAAAFRSDGMGGRMRLCGR